MTNNKEDGVNYTGNTSEKKDIKKEKETITEPNLDLNGDGVFDKKDASIAGRVLAKSRRKKVK